MNRPVRLQSGSGAVLRVRHGVPAGMGLLLALLILVLLFGGAGFAVHGLWIVALVLLVAWLIGFGTRGRRL